MPNPASARRAGAGRARLVPQRVHLGGGRVGAAAQLGGGRRLGRRGRLALAALGRGGAARLGQLLAQLGFHEARAVRQRLQPLLPPRAAPGVRIRKGVRIRGVRGRE